MAKTSAMQAFKNMLSELALNHASHLWCLPGLQYSSKPGRMVRETPVNVFFINKVLILSLRLKIPACSQQ